MRQAGVELPSTDGNYLVSSFSQKLTIVGEGGSEKMELFDGAPLVFKTRRNWAGEGRRVRGISSGYFIVIAPRAWSRHGRVPVEPEDTLDSEFAAHYWAVDDSPEDIGSFEEYAFSLAQKGFELQGTTLFDAGRSGELFVGDLPELRPSHGIVSARIGEEGKPRGWAQNFEPSTELLADVLDGRQGWFFIRVYDKNGLADSGDFRYVQRLGAIQVDDRPYSAERLILPFPDGHAPARIRFVAADGSTLEPRLRHETESPVTLQPDGTLLAEPDPEADLVPCEVEGVDVAVELPRIWWQVYPEDDDANGAWHDRPLAMTRREFRSRAKGGTAIRMRLPASVQSVAAGFNGCLDRSYRKHGSSLEISFADFLDYAQIDERLATDALFQVLCREDVLTVLCIKADPSPTIVSFASDCITLFAGQTARLSWKTRHAVAGGVALEPGIGPVQPVGSACVTPPESTTFTLRLATRGLRDVCRTVAIAVETKASPDSQIPDAGTGRSNTCDQEGVPPEPRPERLVARVRRVGGGTRPGRGFSFRELSTAGLTPVAATRLSVPTDRRRRTVHPENVNVLRSLRHGRSS